MKSFHTTRVQTSDSKVQGAILCSCNTRPLNKSFFFFWFFYRNFMILKNMAQFSLIFSKISKIYNIFFLKYIYDFFFVKKLQIICQEKIKNHWYLLAYKGTYLETKSNEPGYFPILEQMRVLGRPSHGPFIGSFPMNFRSLGLSHMLLVTRREGVQVLDLFPFL